MNEPGPPPGDYALFTIRIGHTHTLGGRRWYGRVEWLNTRQARSFSSLAQLCEFLQATGLLDEIAGNSSSARATDY